MALPTAGQMAERTAAKEVDTMVLMKACRWVLRSGDWMAFSMVELMVWS
jgi:predicted Rdx family selenoprotein